MLRDLISESKAVERALAGEDLSHNDGLDLLKNENLFVAGATADLARKKLVGDKVTFAAS